MGLVSDRGSLSRECRKVGIANGTWHTAMNATKLSLWLKGFWRQRQRAIGKEAVAAAMLEQADVTSSSFRFRRWQQDEKTF